MYDTVKRTHRFIEVECRKNNLNNSNWAHAFTAAKSVNVPRPLPEEMRK